MRLLAALLCVLVACTGYQPAPGWPHPDEDQFLYYCHDGEDGLWEVQGHKEDATCDDPFVPTWDHFPLMVVATSDLQSITLSAVESWNYFLGFEVFRMTTTMEGADIFVWFQESPAFTAIALHGTFDGKHVAGVQVGHMGSINPRWMAHELGHVMGLYHDFGKPHSIMSYKHGLAWLDADDKRALLRKYGRWASGN